VPVAVEALSTVAVSTQPPSSKEPSMLHRLPFRQSLRSMVALMIVSLGLVGCASSTDEPAAASEPEADILAIGDSIFAWNREQGASIPEVVGAELGRTVLNEAVSGAQFVDERDGAAENGGDIRAQYANLGQVGFEWVIVDGGGNDVNDDCRCRDCAEVLNALISADGTEGAMVDFAREVVADGSNVLFVGYAELPPNTFFGFGQCGDELDESSRRLGLMADSVDGVWFVDAADVVTGTDLDSFDLDLVHPSVEGSAVIGRHVAQAIEAAEAEG
jgi:lysophospholipase L1-like esterase